MIGRVFLSLFFIATLVSQILSWNATHQNFVETLYTWLNYPLLPGPFPTFFKLLLSYSSLCLLLGLVLLGVGALLVLLGIKVRLGASLLILVLLPTTLIMHAFWLHEAGGREIQMIHFLKNFSILGGLFVLLASNGMGE